MLPSNKSKFNNPKGKTRYFPIKQFRFDTTKSPILNSKSKCSFKVKSLLSQQEELMLKGLSNSFQIDNTKAFRIALSKVCTIGSEELEASVPFSLAQTKLKGHTARNRKVEYRIPKEEKEALQSLAIAYKLTEQATVRLVLIHTAKGIRSGTLDKFEGCKLLSQTECWDAWSKDKPVSSGKLDALKKARDLSFEQAKDEREERSWEKYKRNGEMIKKLYREGGYIPTDLNGEIDITYVEQCVALEEGEIQQRNWEMYLEDLQRDGRSEMQIKIEKQLFYARQIGIYDMTEDEAIAIIKDEEEEERYWTEDRQEALVEEIQRQNNLQRELELAEKLGHPIYELTFAEVLQKKQEILDEGHKKFANHLAEQKRIKRDKKNRYILKNGIDTIQRARKAIKYMEETGKKNHEFTDTTISSDYQHQHDIISITQQRLIDYIAKYKLQQLWDELSGDDLLLLVISKNPTSL